MPTYDASLVGPNNIHDISLQNWAGPILDQGNLGTCAENTFVTIIDMEMRMAGKSIPPLSRLGLYSDVRDAQHTFNTDSGTDMNYLFSTAQTKGVGFESTWGYDPNNLYVHPTSNYSVEASQHLLGGVTYLSVESQYFGYENEIKAELSQGKPVFLAFRIEPHFWNQYAPYWGDEAPVGGHAVAIIGVSENGTPNDVSDDYYIIKNSWGTGWGDGGYGKIGVREFDAPFNGQNPLGLMGFYTLNGFNGIDLTYTQARKDVADAYVALLNRAPDHSGQDWWASVGLTKGGLITELLKCPEEQAIFGNTNNAQFIDIIYNNTLDRQAGTDLSGRAFWTQALDNGNSRGDILAEIITLTETYRDGQVSDPTLDAAARHSRDYFNDKADVAMHLGITYQSDNLDVAHVALIGVTDNYNSVISAEQIAAHSLGYI